MSTIDARLRGLLALLVSIALCWPSSAVAGPTEPESPKASDSTPSEPESVKESAPPPRSEAKGPAAVAAPTTVDEAIEAGDLGTAAELAREARQADPSPATWHDEGRVLELMGDYEGAARAYRAEIDALPDDAEAAKRAARADLERVRADSRGTVPTEPASTHRDELDERWAPAPAPPKPKPKAKPVPDAEPKDDEKIVRKWYFWVTVIAIAASAAAVTGIAIKASRDERDDALSLTPSPSMQGPPVFRF